MSTLAVLVIFQPFVDLAEAIIKFFAENVGLSWGLSIVMLTLTVPSASLVSTFRSRVIENSV